VKVHIRLFAVAKQLAGRDQLTLELPPGCTLGGLRQALAAHAPQLASIIPQVLFAIDSEYAGDDRVICDGNEIACIPPVSGG
jgi:molybdopterin converting factor subunit 1